MNFTYNLGKNIKLKLERGIGFENVIELIEKDRYSIAKITSENHAGQKCFIVKYNGKYWIVPFKEYTTKIHLFTIFKKD